MDHQTHSKKIESNYGRETGSVLSFVLFFCIFLYLQYFNGLTLLSLILLFFCRLCRCPEMWYRTVLERSRVEPNGDPPLTFSRRHSEERLDGCYESQGQCEIQSIKK